MRAFDIDIMMFGVVCRNVDDSLSLFLMPPNDRCIKLERSDDGFWEDAACNNVPITLPSSMFPGVSWESEPLRVKGLMKMVPDTTPSQEDKVNERSSGLH